MSSLENKVLRDYRYNAFSCKVVIINTIAITYNITNSTHASALREKLLHPTQLSYIT